MAKYILLANWADQRISNIKDLAKRLDAGLVLAKQGCVYENCFMTMGSFDMVSVIEAPNDETLAKNNYLRGTSHLASLVYHRPKGGMLWVRS
jgi:uncharacterized protein with GYD domain